MKIVLFSYNSSFVHTNLAIRCIRDSLSEAGFSSEIIEKTEKDPYDRCLYALFSKKADIYGFSTYIWNIEASEKLARDLKKLCPDSKIVFGGPEVSFNPESYLDENSYIDSIICGEGEEAFVSLCKNFRSGMIYASEYAKFEESSIHYKNDENFKSNIVYYESSRGCPFRCSYCLSANENRLRMKSVQKTLDDLREFEKIDGIKIVKFVDRTFNADRKRAKEIWKALLSDSFTKKYHFEICASLVDEETVDILSKFPKGKIQLEIGVQSTNIQTLEAINRNDDPEKVLETIEKLHDLGNMHIHADLIAGLPFEDYKTFKNSFNSLFGKCDMLQLGFLKLLKGAPIEKDISKYGYIFSSFPPYEILRNDFLSESDLMKLSETEKILDRFSSGKFERSLSYLAKKIPPFELFEELSENIPDITKLSQINAYSSLYEYALSRGLADDFFKDSLRLDFLLNESGRLPEEIGINQSRDPEIIHSFFDENKDFFVQATEVYTLFGKTYFIDRKNRKEIHF